MSATEVRADLRSLRRGGERDGDRRRRLRSLDLDRDLERGMLQGESLLLPDKGKKVKEKKNPFSSQFYFSVLPARFCYVYIVNA